MISDTLYFENDKSYAPFLLAASTEGMIEYKGVERRGQTVYLIFYPKAAALELINKYDSKKDLQIPPKSIFDAIETFWRKIKELK